jgi:hypothetical protein
MSMRETSMAAPQMRQSSARSVDWDVERGEIVDAIWAAVGDPRLPIRRFLRLRVRIASPLVETFRRCAG